MSSRRSASDASTAALIAAIRFPPGAGMPRQWSQSRPVRRSQCVCARRPSYGQCATASFRSTQVAWHCHPFVRLGSRVDTSKKRGHCFVHLRSTADCCARPASLKRLSTLTGARSDVPAGSRRVHAKCHPTRSTAPGGGPARLAEAATTGKTRKSPGESRLTYDTSRTGFAPSTPASTARCSPPPSTVRARRAVVTPCAALIDRSASSSRPGVASPTRTPPMNLDSFRASAR